MSEVKSPRYSLRPRASAFDLKINRNRYGLVRQIIGRKGAQMTQAKCQSINSSPSSSPCRSRSPSPLPDANKRKIRYEPADTNDDAKQVCVISNNQSNKAITTGSKVWHLPDRTTQIVRKPPPTFYDVTEGE